MFLARKFIITYLLCSVFVPFVRSQTNTVGVLFYDPSKALDGYLLLYPQNQGTAFIVNNCGEVVHQWIDNSAGPSNIAHFMEDGSLFMAKMDNGYMNPWISGGGGGQKIEHRDWDNNLLWQYYYSDSLKRMHHDFTVLPNGNVVIIAWERKLFLDCIGAGRDSNLLADGEVWPDHLVEIQPTGLATGNIVWEWHAWDHLIQDQDTSLPNYGIISDHPELINLNYINGYNNADWLHFNSIDYNTELDQLIISTPTWNEVWIIDHSTTTIEASSHTGGNSGMGGDLIYRWGNPEAYGRGDSSNRMLGFQHDIHWMDEELPLSHPNGKKLMLFNNKRQPGVSNANIIAPVFDTITNQYQMLGNTYLPVGFDYSYTTPNPSDMFCAVVSSAQRLPNGNTLICSGRKGYTLEVDSLNEIVWEYKTPLNAGSPVSQGSNIPLSGNFTFRTKKYSSDWPGFAGHSLTPMGYIELNPDTNYCTNILGIEVDETEKIVIYPNPSSNLIYISGFEQGEKIDVNILDITGKMKLSKTYVYFEDIMVDISSYSSGLYILSVVDSNKKLFQTKIIKQ